MMKINTGAMLLLALLLAACGQPEPEPEERLRPVRYVTVNDDRAFRDRSFSGTSNPG